jgi:hypothetical protein
MSAIFSFQDEPVFSEPLDTSILGKLGVAFSEPDGDIFDERRRRRKKGGKRGKSRRSRGGSGCFVNPRTGVRMRAMGGRRGFKRC